MKKNITFLLVFLLLITAKTGFSQIWEPIGPEGTNIINIQATSNALFAAGYMANNPSGLWRSGSNGETWENLTPLFTNKKIRNMWTCQDSILVSVAPRNVGGLPQPDGGVFLSTNNGGTWSTLLPIGGFYEPETFLKKGGYMFFGGLNGVTISNDLGQTWTTSTGGQSGQSYQVKCFETIGDTIFIGTRKGLFRSINNCVTWTAASAGIPTTPVGANWITSMTKIGGTLYATSSIKGVYKSTNLGVSWVAVNNGITDLKANSIYYNGTALFAGTYYTGIFKSTDGGASWTSATQGLINESVNCFYQHGNKLFSGGQAGIFESYNHGESWEEVNDGLLGQVIGSGRGIPSATLIHAGNYLFAGSYSGRIFRSSDNGGHWQPVGGEIRVGGLGFFNGLAGNESVVFASAYDSKLYKSVDFGLNWTVAAFPENNCPEKMLVVNNRIYGSLYDWLFYTDDNGQNWVQQPTANGCGAIINKGNDIFMSGLGYNEYNNVYMMAEGDTVFTHMGDVSTDGVSISAFGVLGDTLFAAVAGEGVYRSVNNGVSWIFDGLPGIGLNGFVTAGDILFARNSFNIYVRNNTNGTWMNINSNLPMDDQGSYSNAMFANQGKLFAAVSSKSLYTTDLAQFTFIAPNVPGAIIGSPAPCIGSSQIYSVPNVPYVTYAWQFPVGWVVTSGNSTSTVTVTVGSTPGVVLVTPSNLWGTGPSQFFIVFPNTSGPNQPSAITGSTSPPEGSTQIYSVVNDPGVFYSWSFPSGWMQTAGSNTNSVSVLVGSATGNIQVSPSTACGTGTSRTLAVTPVPSSLTISTVTIASGQTNCYNATGTIYVAGSGSTFTIENGGSATMIAGQNIIYYPETKVFEGGYMHGYISTEFCTNPENPVVNNPQAAGDVAASWQKNMNVNRIMIYPNPTSGVFTLEQTGLVGDQTLKFEIYTMLGKRIISENAVGGQKQQFNFGNAPTGIYLVRIITGEKIETIKLVKQ